MKPYKILSLFLLLTGALPVMAQNTVGDEDVDVVSEYNPVLVDAVKENFTPQIPEHDTKPEALEYNIPIEFFQVAYQPLKVKPVRLPDADPEDLDHVYVKAGFGTQLTPLAEAYVNSDRSEKVNYAFYGKYISSNGSLENQNYSDMRLGGSGKFFIEDKYAVPVSAFYSANTLYYYGYDDEDTTFESSDVKQRFNRYGFDIGFHNTGENPLDLDFGIKAGFSGISDINQYKENNPYLTAFAEKELLNEHIGGVAVSYDYYKYTGAGENSNYLTGIKPYYKIMNDEWSLNAGFELKVDKESFSYFLPDAVFSYDLVGDKFVFVAGLHGVLQKNNFANIVADNPFVLDTLLYKNSTINEIFAGLRGSTNGNFSFSLKGYQKVATDLPFYITDSADTKRFDVVYSDATLWGGNLEIAYFNTDKFNFTGSVNAFTFSEIKKFDQPYHRPTLEWTLGGMYRFNRKMMMNVDVFGIGSTVALLPDGTEADIKGTVDLNLSATYAYSKYFNIFVNLSNMANFKYERFYNYPGYGAQILGGLSFTF